MSINATYAEVSSQTDENAEVALGTTIIVRVDLIDPAPPPPSIVLSLDCTSLTDSAGKPIGNVGGVTGAGGVANFSSGYLTSPDHAELDFGAGDFKINATVKMASINTGGFQTFFGKGDSANNCWYVGMFTQTGTNNGKIEFVSQNNNIRIIGASGIADTTAFHDIELKRIGSTVTLSVDGVSVGTTGVSPIDSNGPMYLGTYPGIPGGSRFTGAMNKYEVVKG